MSSKTVEEAYAAYAAQAKGYRPFAAERAGFKAGFAAGVAHGAEREREACINDIKSQRADKNSALDAAKNIFIARIRQRGEK